MGVYGMGVCMVWYYGYGVMGGYDWHDGIVGGLTKLLYCPVSTPGQLQCDVHTSLLVLSPAVSL